MLLRKSEHAWLTFTKKQGSVESFNPYLFTSKSSASKLGIFFCLFSQSFFPNLFNNCFLFMRRLFPYQDAEFLCIFYYLFCLFVSSVTKLVWILRISKNCHLFRSGNTELAPAHTAPHPLKIYPNKESLWSSPNTTNSFYEKWCVARNLLQCNKIKLTTHASRKKT